MGVHGLWQILSPCGRRIDIGALRGHTLAVDASIWLIQFIKAMRTEDGRMVPNAHLIGTLRRILRLLFHKIKPIFVFDGGTPLLKRRIMELRRQKMEQSSNLVNRAARRLLAHKLLEQKGSKEPDIPKPKSVVSSFVIPNSEKKSPASQKAINNKENEQSSESSSEEEEDDDIVWNTNTNDSLNNNKAVENLEMQQSASNDVIDIVDNDDEFGNDDEDHDNAEEIDSIIEQLPVKSDGLVDLSSISILPQRLQYEIIARLKDRRRQRESKRNELMPVASDPTKYSTMQLKHFLKDVKLKNNLDTMQQRLVQSGSDGKRIASESSRRYILVDKSVAELSPCNSSNSSSLERINESVSNQDDSESSVTKARFLPDDLFADNPVQEALVAQPSVSSQSIMSSAMSTASYLTPWGAGIIKHAFKKRPGCAEDEWVDNKKLKADEGEMDVIHDRTNESFTGIPALNNLLQCENIATHDELIRFASSLCTDKPERLSSLVDMFGNFEPLIMMRWLSEIVGLDIITDATKVNALIQSIDVYLLERDMGLLCFDAENHWTVMRTVHGKAWDLNPRNPFPSTIRLLDLSREVTRLRSQDWIVWFVHGPLPCKSDNESQATSMVKPTIFPRLDTKSHVKSALSSQNNTHAFPEAFPCAGKIEVVTVSEEKSCGDADHNQAKKASTIEEIIEEEYSGPQEYPDDVDNDVSHVSKDMKTVETGVSEKAKHVLAMNQNMETVEMVYKVSSELEESENDEKQEPQEQFTRGDKQGQFMSDEKQEPQEQFTRDDKQRQSMGDEKQEPQEQFKRDDKQGQSMGDEKQEPQEQFTSGGKQKQPTRDEKREEYSFDEENSTPYPVNEDLQYVKIVDQDTSLEGPVEKNEIPQETFHNTNKDVDVLPVIQTLVEHGESEDDKDEHVVDPSATLAELQNIRRTHIDHNEPLQHSSNVSSLQPIEEDAEEQRLNQMSVEELQRTRKAAQRDSETVTPMMLEEVKELLTLFGLPYVESPMEAEAQCAHLELAGVVDGIVTEDCDAFLFGGKNIYKNLFEDFKFVEAYRTLDIKQDLGLTRESLVDLAMLLGSDYTTGVKGVGIVNATEIVQSFSSLEKFRDWVNGNDEVNDEREEWSANLERFKKSHQSARKRWIVAESFPAKQVISAYLHPEVVDVEKSSLRWVEADVENLVLFCMNRFGWSAKESLRHLEKPLKEFANRDIQTTLDGFVKVYSDNERFASFRSRRLQTAVAQLRENKKL